jgi:hypothetical protein
LNQSDEGRDEPGERASPTAAISDKPGITPVPRRLAMGFAAMTAKMPNARIASEPSPTKKVENHRNQDYVQYSNQAFGRY